MLAGPSLHLFTKHEKLTLKALVIFFWPTLTPRSFILSFFQLYGALSYAEADLHIFWPSRILTDNLNRSKLNEVHILFEGHKSLRNYYSTYPVKSKVKILQNFVAFSEHMNFTMILLADRSTEISIATVSTERRKYGVA